MDCGCLCEGGIGGGGDQQQYQNHLRHLGHPKTFTLLVICLAMNTVNKRQLMNWRMYKGPYIWMSGSGRYTARIKYDIDA